MGLLPVWVSRSQRRFLANGRSGLFPETGYAVQDEFLTFYETYSGTQLSAPPISPQLDEGGLRVQYFL
ncbi:MAG: hypothetical protein R3E31_16320 [Chloroflexota bacterium]